MEFPDDMPSTHDKLDKDKASLRAFQALYYIKDLLSYFKQIPARNDRQVCPEPCFHFNATTFLPPDLQYPSFSDFDPCKIIKLLGEKQVDKDSDLGVINNLKLSPEKAEIDRQLEDQSDVVQVLANLVKERKIDQLVQSGGVKSLASSLCTNLQYGIHADPEEVSSRQEIFGSNKYRIPTKSLFSFFLEGLENIALLILLACGALSVGLGMKADAPKEGWYDGASIFMVAFLVISVYALREFWGERQLDKLYLKISENVQVEVVRSGKRQQISVFEIVVGDIVSLKIGDQVPADGLFLNGHSLKIDESSMTGESDQVDVNSTRNPFLISGTKVADGYATMLITSVGMNTMWGEMMSTISRGNNEDTPLHGRLHKLATSIGMVGLAVAFLILVVLFVWYFTGSTADDNGKKEFNKSKTKAVKSIETVVGMIAFAFTILVVAVPEGLPLAVPLTLAYSMKRMVADRILVRNVSACETMASATTICTDKTGTLTLNMMRVVEFWIGQELMGERNSISGAGIVLELLQEGVGLNTAGSVYKPTLGSDFEFSGSPTEKSMLYWAFTDLKMDIEELKRRCVILRIEAFNSVKKRSGVLMKKNADDTIHVHWKGAAEIILAVCSQYYNHFGEIKSLDDVERKKFEQLIQGMAASGLRCIAFAYKQVLGSAFDNGKGDQNIPDDDLLLLGLIGIKDPCRPGVRDAVRYVQNAGVKVVMITGDHVFTATAVATDCGILGPNQDVGNGQVIEGHEFRNSTHNKRMEMVDRICVMARSSPLDKLLMVQCLRQKGHVIALTGDAANDAPALKEADVGLSMGIQGTDVAKECSDIIILDDNFASVARAVRWGRCAYNNIQKFIQFHLTFIVAALVIIFLAAVLSGDRPLTVTQLLWVYLIMDTLGALTLATERPTDELMHRTPIGRGEPVVSNVMWRDLIFQALYQIATILTLQFKGEEIFKVNKKVRETLIFNTFVLCQVFNLVNARKLEKKNIFKGLHRNKLFVAIIGFVLVLQMVMVELLNKFAHTERLNWGQWGACIALAAVSWPVGFVVKFIPVPEKPFTSFLKWRT